MAANRNREDETILRDAFRKMDADQAQEIREAYYKAVEGLRCLADALEIADAKNPGIDGVRDVGLLHSAVAMPQTSFGGQYLHADLFEMASSSYPYPNRKSSEAPIALAINVRED